MINNPSDPNLSDVLNLLKKDVMLSLNCHAIATVQSFDSSNQTVKATINYKKTYYQKNAETNQYDPVFVDYPVLVDCPTIFLGGGALSLRMPVKAGDECLILFNDRDIDTWFSSSQIKAPNSNRLHSFADGIALVGIRSAQNALEDWTDQTAELTDGTSSMKVGGASSKAGFYRQAAKIEVNASEKVEISNTIGALGALLQELISEIQTLVTLTSAITVTGVAAGGGSSGPPANSAAILVVGTQITVTATKIQGLLV